MIENRFNIPTPNYICDQGPIGDNPQAARSKQIERIRRHEDVRRTRLTVT